MPWFISWQQAPNQNFEYFELTILKHSTQAKTSFGGLFESKQTATFKLHIVSTPSE